MMNQSAMSNTSAPPSPAASGQARPDELIRIFNTALVSSQAGSNRDFSGEIFELMESPAFRAILGAVRQYARLQAMSEKQAAEQIISTFRKMDQVWRDYVFQEGVDRLKNSGI